MIPCRWSGCRSVVRSDMSSRGLVLEDVLTQTRREAAFIAPVDHANDGITRTNTMRSRVIVKSNIQHLKAYSFHITCPHAALSATSLLLTTSVSPLAYQSPILGCRNAQERASLVASSCFEKVLPALASNAAYPPFPNAIFVISSRSNRNNARSRVVQRSNYIWQRISAYPTASPDRTRRGPTRPDKAWHIWLAKLCFAIPAYPNCLRPLLRDVVQQSALAALAAAIIPTTPVHPRIDVSKSVAK